MSWQKMIWVFLLTGIVAGCASTLSYDQIRQKAEAVNFQDGVDQSEATLIAQKFVLDKGLDAEHPVNNVGEVRRTQDGSAWLVNFKGVLARGASQYRRFDFTQPITIRVDAANGKAEVFNQGQ